MSQVQYGSVYGDDEQKPDADEDESERGTTHLPEIKTSGQESSMTKGEQKRRLMALNGTKLQKHLEREGRNVQKGKHSIATDLSMWMADDQ